MTEVTEKKRVQNREAQEKFRKVNPEKVKENIYRYRENNSNVQNYNNLKSQARGYIREFADLNYLNRAKKNLIEQKEVGGK